MDIVHKNYLQHAVQDVLDLLEKANSMIALHQAQAEVNAVILEGYQRQRQQFLEQLAELLEQYQVEVVVPKSAA